MKEALPINKEYNIINGFAVKFGIETKLIDLFNIKDIIIPLGGKIRYVTEDDYLQSNFIVFNDKNDFDVSILSGVNKQFERLLLVQAIGHYVLHADRGNNICYIGSASKGEVAKEGFLFSLSLLVPDIQFLKLKDNFDDNYISKLFRVPDFAIRAKRKIIDKVY